MLRFREGMGKTLGGSVMVGAISKIAVQ